MFPCVNFAPPAACACATPRAAPREILTRESQSRGVLPEVVLFPVPIRGELCYNLLKEVKFVHLANEKKEIEERKREYHATN